MSNQTKRLTYARSAKLYNLLEQQKGNLNGKSPTQIASVATTTLGFTVAPSSVTRIAKDLGYSFQIRSTSVEARTQQLAALTKAVLLIAEHTDLEGPVGEILSSLTPDSNPKTDSPSVVD